jgi:hypothetical protein
MIANFTGERQTEIQRGLFFGISVDIFSARVLFKRSGTRRMNRVESAPGRNVSCPEESIWTDDINLVLEPISQKKCLVEESGESITDVGDEAKK